MSVSDFSDLLERRVGVKHEGIGRESVSTEDFLGVGRELDGCDLRRSDDCVKTGTSRCGPNVNPTVASPTTRGENIWVPGRPCNSLRNSVCKRERSEETN